MPGIAEASSQVTDALQQVGQLPAYNGPFVAQPNAVMTGQAQAAYQGAANTAQDLSRYVLQQAQMDPTAAIQAATAPVFRQLTDSVLPGIKSSALASGAYSGDRANTVLPGLAIRDATTSANELASKFAYDRLSMLPDLADTALRLQTGSGDILNGITGLDTQQQQASIDNAMAAADYSVKYPFQGLDIASALLAQLSGNYGTTTSNGTQTSIQTTGGLGNVLQGVLGAASLASSFPTRGGGTLLGSLFKKG